MLCGHIKKVKLFMRSDQMRGYSSQHELALELGRLRIFHWRQVKGKVSAVVLGYIEWCFSTSYFKLWMKLALATTASFILPRPKMPSNFIWLNIYKNVKWVSSYVLGFFHDANYQLVINAIGVQANVVFEEDAFHWAGGELDVNFVADFPLLMIRTW